MAIKLINIAITMSNSSGQQPAKPAPSEQQSAPADVKDNWKEGKLVPGGTQSSLKIDLSAKDGMQFKTELGTCKHCKGKWPLLVNIQLCQACILIYLPDDIRGKNIITSDGHMAKEPI